MESMPSTRFLSFVARLPHYEGAIRHAAILAMRHDDESPEQNAAGHVTLPIDADPASMGNTDAMAIHPVWGQVGTYSKAPLE